VTVLDSRDDARFEPHGHDEAHGHDHADEDQHGHGSGHGEGHDAAEGPAGTEADADGHEHAHGGTDSHLWLDPDNAILWLWTIAETLAGRDPENAPRYRENAEKAVVDIRELTETLRADLGPLQGRPFIVFHDSYQYFERAFGVTATAAITLGDAGTANAARLARVRDIVAETGARCALAEPRVNAGLIDAVSRDTAIGLVTLDAVGVDLEPGAGYYTALLRQIGQGLADCLAER
jgi:zinc transport system substrate-binding protein